MNAFDQYEVWFVTGAQLLYGGDAVIAVDAHSNEMVKGLNESGKLPVKVVYKGSRKARSSFKYAVIFFKSLMIYWRKFGFFRILPRRVEKIYTDC